MQGCDAETLVNRIRLRLDAPGVSHHLGLMVQAVWCRMVGRKALHAQGHTGTNLATRTPVRMVKVWGFYCSRMGTHACGGFWQRGHDYLSSDYALLRSCGRVTGPVVQPEVAGQRCGHVLTK
jgi:hypothetical protein